MWKVAAKRGYLSIRGENVYAVVDPSEIPEDLIDIDFVILTRKPKNKKVIDEILRNSKATLVGSSKNVKRYTSDHYVEEVKGVRGLAPGLWVANVRGKVVIGIDDTDEYLILISEESQREEAEDLGKKIYGTFGRVVALDKVVEEHLGEEL